MATIAVIVFLLTRPAPDDDAGVKPPSPNTSASLAPTVLTEPEQVVGALSAIPPKDDVPDVPLTEVERHQQVDRKNLTAIYGGLKAFHAKHGRYPNYLSELVPDFVPADALESPRSEEDGMNRILKRDHLDPGLEKPAYGYEYSNLEAYGNRTFQEIKDVQKAEWGDVVPLLRAFGYDKVINMSWGGDLYETQLMLGVGRGDLRHHRPQGMGTGHGSSGEHRGSRRDRRGRTPVGRS